MTKAEFQEAMKEALAQNNQGIAEALKNTLSNFFEERKKEGAPPTAADLKEIVKQVMAENAPAPAKEEPKKLFGLF